MVPEAEITFAAESAASAAGSTIPDINALDKHPARRLRIFIGAIPFDSVDKSAQQPRCAPRLIRGSNATQFYERVRQRVDQAALKKASRV
jgi:hypothetical protein